MADALLIKTLVVIVASVGAIGLVARARLPAAVGYLLAGLVIGPHGLQLIATSDETTFLAELGIIFLMFMVGLEFSLAAMIAARRDVFGAGRRWSGRCGSRKYSPLRDSGAQSRVLRGNRGRGISPRHVAAVARGDPG